MSELGKSNKWLKIHGSARETGKTRYIGSFQSGGISQSMFTLISSAIGGGVLCLPYAISIAGLVNGILLMIYGFFLAYSSVKILLISATKTGIASYGELLAFACNSKMAGRFLDMVTILFGQGVIISYFVFLGDFIPELSERAHLAKLFDKTHACINEK